MFMNPKSYNGFTCFLYLQNKMSYIEFTYPQYTKKEEEILYNITYFIQYIKNHWNYNVKELITNREATLERMFTN